MSPIVSEISILTVDPDKFSLDSPEFAKLRDAASQGGAKEQYYGISMDKPDKLVWVLNWPGYTSPAEFQKTEESEAFRESLKALDKNATPSSWFIPFKDAELIRPALTAPLCQLCTVHIAPTSVLETLAESLHKTFTDCYLADGFKGGHWATAINDERQNYYYLGWESRKHHDDYAKTELFAVEIDKLKPHMDEGTTHYLELKSYS